jgi:hypothetical protein
VAETWILLSAALALALERYRVPHVAKTKLIEALRQGKVRWRCAGFDGFRYNKDEPGDGDPHFWCDWSGPPWDPPQRAGFYQPALRFDWEHDYVRRYRHGAFRIEVVWEELEAWLEIALELDPTPSGDPSGAEPAAPAHSISQAKLKAAAEHVAQQYAEGEQADFEEFYGKLTQRLGRKVSRSDARIALKEYAPRLQRSRGRPRTDPNQPK